MDNIGFVNTTGLFHIMFQVSFYSKTIFVFQ